MVQNTDTSQKHKFTYTLRTIPVILKELKRIEAVTRNEFIPATSGGHQCSNVERNIIALPVKLGGLGITKINDNTNFEYEASRKITEQLVSLIKKQNTQVHEDFSEQLSMKNEIKKARNDRLKRDHIGMV